MNDTFRPKLLFVSLNLNYILTKEFHNIINFEIQFQVTVPSMASVFNEYALKSQFETSIYLQVNF